MVAKEISVISKKAGENSSWKWVSDGKGGFNLEKTKTMMWNYRYLEIKDDANEFLETMRLSM